MNALKVVIDTNVLVSILRVIKSRAVRVNPQNPFIEICRDPKDNMILAAALSGKADFLVTGDKDILAVRLVSDCQILPPFKFLEALQQT